MAKTKALKPLEIKKLRVDMQLIMDELDKTGDKLDDAYSSHTWQRLQVTTENVADAIRSLQLYLGGMSCAEVENQTGVKKAAVAAYSAWNTMLQPGWVAPRVIIAQTICPVCDAAKGQPCNYRSAPAHKIHNERRESYATQIRAAA